MRVHITGQLLKRGTQVADGKVHRERTKIALIFNQFKVKVESKITHFKACLFHIFFTRTYRHLPILNIVSSREKNMAISIIFDISPNTRARIRYTDMHTTLARTLIHAIDDPV